VKARFLEIRALLEDEGTARPYYTLLEATPTHDLDVEFEYSRPVEQVTEPPDEIVLKPGKQLTFTLKAVRREKDGS
jgi:hypothetical protein